MSSEKPTTLVAELEARSGLGSVIGGPGQLVHRDAGLTIAEEAGLPVRSLRRPRVAANETWLPRQLRAQNLDLAMAPRQLAGDPVLSCARVEPHAWLICGELHRDDPAPAGWLSTELGDRLCAFRLSGPRAADVLASGGNLHGVTPGICARMPFADAVAVYVQCFASDQYRLLVDVSFAPFMARWLADAANNRIPPEGRP